MSQPNQYYVAPIRNSYGYQQQSSYRANGQSKTYQPYNSSYQQDNKLTSSIRTMQNRVDGVQAMVRQKKNYFNQQQFKSTISGQSNAFQVHESVKNVSPFNNYSATQNFNVQKHNQLRGSCPNIFKKFDQSSGNLRSTTQFANMSKYGFVNNDPNRKQKNLEQAQNGIVRTMKKNLTTFINQEQPLNNKILSSNKNESFYAHKVQQFNPNKSVSSGQLANFRYNFPSHLNKSGIKKQQQWGTHSPARIIANKTPSKLSKLLTESRLVTQPDKKASQMSIKTSANSTSYTKLIPSQPTLPPNRNNLPLPDSQQKKFKSLHQIWQIKQRQKTQKKITQSLHPSKTLNGFQLGRVLGKGKFGQVFLARHQATGFVAAIKKIVKAKVVEYKMTEQFTQEIRLHNALDHPNIVKFFGVFQQDGHVYLVMEYMNGGTLFDCLNQVSCLGVKQTIEYLRDVIEAVVYLHEKSIAHRDIKPENIVISSEGVAKLCDFGWSAVVETSRKTYCGTFDYAPPQILQRKSYDMSVDVWCIGVLTYQLLTGRVPFEGQKRNDIKNKIVNVDKNKIQYPVDVPKQAKDFIELLVQKQPGLRPKPNQLLKHPFFSLCPPKVKSKKLQ